MKDAADEAGDEFWEVHRFQVDSCYAGSFGGCLRGEVSVAGRRTRAGRTSGERERVSVRFARQCWILGRFADWSGQLRGLDPFGFREISDEVDGIAGDLLTVAGREGPGRRSGFEQRADALPSKVQGFLARLRALGFRLRFRIVIHPVPPGVLCNDAATTESNSGDFQDARQLVRQAQTFE